MNKKGTQRNGGSVVDIFYSTFTDVPETVQQKGINEAEITLKWIEPEHNGANITKYSIYQRIANDERWTKLAMITNTTGREYVVEVEKGEEYEFVVTATNKNGESAKDDIKTVKMAEGAS